MKKFQGIWDHIRRGENIELYVIVIVAFILVALSLFGVATERLVASITLAVLGLLAISTLGTRDYIEEQLRKFPASLASTLKERSELPPIKERGQDASEIVVAGVSLITAVVPNLGFFEQKMKAGCRLRFLLLDPSPSPALQTWDSISKVPNTKADIEQSLKSLEVLIHLEKTTKGKCEVRLANVFLPFGIAAFDPSKDTGFMSVEFVIYKKALGERPHIKLMRANDKKWFDFFKSQFEDLWVESVKWNPSVTD